MTPIAQGQRRRMESGRAREPAAPYVGTLEDVERAHVQRILAQSATFEEAAELLGINLTTLWRKRKRWGLS